LHARCKAVEQAWGYFVTDDAVCGTSKAMLKALGAAGLLEEKDTSVEIRDL
jgi:hypothetical protein